MTVTVANGYLEVFRPNPLMRSGGSTQKAKLPGSLTTKESISIGQSFIRSVNGHAFLSGTTMFMGVRTLFAFLDVSGNKLPKTGRQTELFLADSQKYVLTGKMPHNPMPESRAYLWTHYSSLIRQLMYDKKLPTVTIPLCKLPSRDITDDTSQLGVLGESLVPFPMPMSPQEIWPDCYLGMPSYVEPTDEFLDHIHEKLKGLAHETVTAAEEYWNSNISKYKALRERIDAVDPQHAAKLLHSFKNKTISHFTPEIDPTTEMGLLNILAIIKYMLINHDDIKNLSLKALANSNPRFAFKIPLQVIVTKEITKLVGQEVVLHGKVARALRAAFGLPNATDISAAMVVLINDNPNFNPMALGQAKLTNKNGKRYLIAKTEHTPARFSIEKPRSKSRKESNLSDRSLRIVDELLDHTDILRTKLLKAHHPAAHSLFIEITSRGINESIVDPHLFTGKKYSLWNALKDRLTAAGIAIKNFNLSTIRNTQGILEWFRTGSVRMMAKKMGNKTQTVLKSYMPPWILRRQYERVARAFQQKMIVLANLNCPWLLAASDFNTKEDLKSFLASTLLRPNGRDQFTNAMEEGFRSQFPDEFEPFKNLKSKFLCLNLAPESLAALRLYLDASNNQPQNQTKSQVSEDAELEISVSDLKLLARMMQATVELPVTSSATKAIRSNLQGNSFRELIAAWDDSTKLLSEWQQYSVHPKLSS